MLGYNETRAILLRVQQNYRLIDMHYNTYDRYSIWINSKNTWLAREL